MNLIDLIVNIFTYSKNKNIYKIDINKLPSQGYFYPDDLIIYMNKGDIDDQLIFHQGMGNGSNIFGFITTIKHILSNRLKFNFDNFNFNMLRAIDVFFIFMLFIKHTTQKKIYFNNIEFTYDTFVYFNFSQYIDNFDKKRNAFVFNNWAFSLPTIGIESSLSAFSYEISLRGLTDIYKDKNYNLIYYLNDRVDISYDEIIELIQLFDELDEEEKDDINKIVDKFRKANSYFLVELGKKSVYINPNMMKEIWPIDSGNIFIS